TKIIVRPADPLAQTFQFDHDTVLTSVGVYFSAKEDGFNVVCQIRNVVNGYPGQEVYAEKALTPSEIKVSPDGTLETKITFDDPVFCRAHTQYCMVFITDSDKAAMFVAELGETDLATKQRVLKNPYLAGMLFSSSNGITWRDHQQCCLVFVCDGDKTAELLADLCDTDLHTEQRVLKNPYLAGMLLSCSNGITCTAYQRMHLNFKVYKA